LSANRPLVIAYFEALLRAERSPALRTALAGDFDALRTTLTNGIAQTLGHHPHGPSPDPSTAATLIMATFDGLIIQWLLDPDQLPSGQLIAETLQRAANLVPTDHDVTAHPQHIAHSGTRGR
ncbi:MAG: TetR family transcriptional regulator C-terminal domain-containing protein, partial [Actinomycetota bacterium]|nr:TetR family transcriptional regulator C-terminal domain-containing protein [Actinomycetota bacterium]